MGQKIWGHIYDRGHWDNLLSGSTTYDVAVAYASSNLGDGTGTNYGIVTIPATKSGLVSNTHPLPVTLEGTDISIDADVDLNVNAFVSSNGTTEVDGAVTAWEGRKMPDGPSITAFVAQDTDSSGQYLTVIGDSELRVIDTGVSSNALSIQKDIASISSNIKGIDGTTEVSRDYLYGISGHIKNMRYDLFGISANMNSLADTANELNSANITGGTTISATYKFGYTGSAVDTTDYIHKTIYISAGALSGIGCTGGKVNIRGSWTSTGEWYDIQSYVYSANTTQYYAINDYHPYIQTHVSGLASGQGRYMTIITGRGN